MSREIRAYGPSGYRITGYVPRRDDTKNWREGKFSVEEMEPGKVYDLFDLSEKVIKSMKLPKRTERLWRAAYSDEATYRFLTKHQDRWVSQGSMWSVHGSGVWHKQPGGKKYYVFRKDGDVPCGVQGAYITENPNWSCQGWHYAGVRYANGVFIPAGQEESDVYMSPEQAFQKWKTAPGAGKDPARLGSGCGGYGNLSFQTLSGDTISVPDTLKDAVRRVTESAEAPHQDAETWWDTAQDVVGGSKTEGQTKASVAIKITGAIVLCLLIYSAYVLLKRR